MDQATPSNFYLTICLYVSFYFLFFTSTSHQLIVPPTDQELNETRRAQSASEQLDPFLAATRQAKATRQVKSIAKARARRTVDTVRGYHSRQHSKQQYQHHSRGNTSSSSAGDKQHQQSYFFQNRHLRQHSRQKSQATRHYPTVTTLFEIPGRYHFEDPPSLPPPPLSSSSFPLSSSLPLANSTTSSPSFNNNFNYNNSNSNIFLDPSPFNGNDGSFTPNTFFQEYNDNPANNGYFRRNTNTNPNNNHNHYNTLTSPSAGLDFQLLQHHTARQRTRLYHQHQLQHHYYTPPFLPTDNPSSSKKQSKQQQQQPIQQQYTATTTATGGSSHPEVREGEQQQHQQQARKASTSIEIQLRPQRYKPPQKHLRIFPRQNQNRYYHFYPDPIFRKKMTTSTTTTTPEPTTATVTTTTVTSSSPPISNKSVTLAPSPTPVASSVPVESTYSTSSTSSTTATPIVAGAPITTPAVENGIQVQQQQQQHQPRTTIGWAEGNHPTNGQTASTIPRSSSSAQAGSGQAQLVGQGQAHTHQGTTTTTTTGGSNASVSTAPLANGSNNNTNYNVALATGQGTTRTRYESKCHLEGMLSWLLLFIPHTNIYRLPFLLLRTVQSSTRLPFPSPHPFLMRHMVFSLSSLFFSVNVYFFFHLFFSDPARSRTINRQQKKTEKTTL
ncbi:MAG: hypothetical protein JOS17DRAFT_326436 [Linnemannia elongata]|nr:MAG: hypothetical protein JOS17DRAFT_326436 [Linnemannia elongata]